MATVLPLIPTDSDAIDFERRFGGIARLYGESALTFFKQAHVCVIGVGGVGSWAVEGLARSAIGKITMIDLDHLSESNVNRQLHALTDTLGKSKVDALAERIAQINPYCLVTRIEEFIDPDNVATLIPVRQFDYVIDAIDNTRAKTALVVHCRGNHIPLVTIGSAGGQVDPTRIAVCDLSRTEQEPLLARVRKRLRRLHGFPRGTKNKFGIDAVYSTEPVRHPELCATDDETNSEMNEGLNGLNCAGYGSAVVVTASFGFVAAGLVLRKLAEQSHQSNQSKSTVSHSEV